MSCVFQNIDPPPPWRTHLPGGEGGQYFGRRKRQDTALYSTYIESSLSAVQENPQLPLVID